MDSIFEKTMRACLEAKKANGKKQVNESRKYVKEDEDEFVDELADDVEGLEGDGEDEIMPGVDTDIIVVVDPENSKDGDYIDPAATAQQIIDNTPDGEIPSTEEFIGNFTYTCPICGNTFFSDVEMHDGDECPVCGDTPDGYVLVGEVQAAAAQEDKVDDEATNVEDTAEDEIIDNEPVDEPEEDSDLEIADVEDDEDEVIDIEAESKKAAIENRHKVGYRTSEMKKSKIGKKVSEKKVEYQLNDVSFNKFLNKFVSENYKNAESFTMKSAKMSGKTLTVECELKFKTGKIKNVSLKAANFNAKNETLAMRDNGAFKCENKATAPFIFSVKNENNVISCTGLRYNIITRMNEGKRVQIYGNLAIRPKMESRKSK